MARLNAGVISSLAPAGDTGAAAPSPALQQVRGAGGAINGSHSHHHCHHHFPCDSESPHGTSALSRCCRSSVTCGLKYLITVLGCSAGRGVDPRHPGLYENIPKYLTVSMSHVPVLMMMVTEINSGFLSIPHLTCMAGCCPLQSRSLLRDCDITRDPGADNVSRHTF